MGGRVMSSASSLGTVTLFVRVSSVIAPRRRVELSVHHVVPLPVVTDCVTTAVEVFPALLAVHSPGFVIDPCDGLYGNLAVVVTVFAKEGRAILHELGREVDTNILLPDFLDHLILIFPRLHRRHLRLFGVGHRTHRDGRAVIDLRGLGDVGGAGEKQK